MLTHLPEQLLSIVLSFLLLGPTGSRGALLSGGLSLQVNQCLKVRILILMEGLNECLDLSHLNSVVQIIGHDAIEEIQVEGPALFVRLEGYRRTLVSLRYH